MEMFMRQNEENIEHLSNSLYRFIEENYIAIIIVIDLSPSPISNTVNLMKYKQ